VRLAALFHDISKSTTQEIDVNRKSIYSDTSYSFHNHENEGSLLTKKILIRLKTSNQIIDSVCNLVKNHMFHYTSDWSDGAVKRFINRVGYENITDLFKLRMCDQEATFGKASWQSVQELEDRIEKIVKKREALTIKDLKINGRDLINLGIEKGPLFSQILNYLLDTVLDDPKMNERDKLLTLAINYHKSLN